MNELYLRLVDVKNVDWHERAQFLAMSAQMMRRILVDAARTRGVRSGVTGSSHKIDIAHLRLGRKVAAENDYLPDSVQEGWFREAGKYACDLYSFRVRCYATDAVRARLRQRGACGASTAATHDEQSHIVDRRTSLAKLGDIP